MKTLISSKITTGSYRIHSRDKILLRESLYKNYCTLVPEVTEEKVNPIIDVLKHFEETLKDRGKNQKKETNIARYRMKY